MHQLLGLPYLARSQFSESRQNSHAPFLKAIRADPHADLPRLIYADWLDEQGNPEGEFIRIQCNLATEQNVDLRQKLKTQMLGHLLRQRRQPQACERLKSLPHHRGIVQGFMADPAKVHTEDIVAALEWGWEWRVNWPQPGPVHSSKMFPYLPELAGLGTLAVDPCQETSRGRWEFIQSLAHNSYLTNLKELYLPVQYAEAFQSASLSQLRTLAILPGVRSRHAIRECKLLHRVSLRNVDVLDLNACKVTARDIHQLVALPVFWNVRALGLTGSNLRKQELTMIGQYAPQLEVLDLRGAKLDDHHAQPLLDEVLFPNLRRLAISKKGMSKSLRRVLRNRFGSDTHQREFPKQIHALALEERWARVTRYWLREL